jgi:hypothetical protein
MSQDGYCNDSRCERTRKGEVHLSHSLQDQDEKTLEKLKALLGLGSNLTGGIGGAATGLLVAGPVGAIIGGAAGTILGHVLKNIGDDYAVRFLSPSEQMRIGGVIIYTMNKVEENLKKGMKLREDDFFREKPGNRSSAKEIAEGILFAAQREYEEKKIRFYGNLLANLGFTTLTRAQANLCLRTGERLSYRQLVLLAIFGQHSKFQLRQKNYHEQTEMQLQTSSILHDIADLERQNLITQVNAVLGITDINPGKMRLEGGLGRTLFHLMELFTIDVEDLDEQIVLLI